VRFELAIKAFAPHMPVIAPWRTWELKSREDEIDYAEAHDIPLRISRETNYSKDKNLWHLSHEGLDLESPENEPQYEKILEMGVTPESAPDVPEYVVVGFEKGIPVSVNGKGMDGVSVIRTLNEIGGRNGVGILDMVENRLVGMKSRGVYETPHHPAHCASGAGKPVSGQADDALQGLCGRQVRRAGLQRHVVHPPA